MVEISLVWLVVVFGEVEDGRVALVGGREARAVRLSVVSGL